MKIFRDPLRMHLLHSFGVVVVLSIVFYNLKNNMHLIFRDNAWDKMKRKNHSLFVLLYAFIEVPAAWICLHFFSWSFSCSSQFLSFENIETIKMITDVITIDSAQCEKKKEKKKKRKFGAHWNIHFSSFGFDLMCKNQMIFMHLTIFFFLSIFIANAKAFSSDPFFLSQHLA